MRWRVGDFFSQPFYAIEYALAEVVAILFLDRYERDAAEGFETYLRFCRLGGSKPLLAALD
ncbi:MAG: hypothetical protein FJZ01_11165 [Candidatus Sericytochromatia bacterium]|nr:hypothetical protein [Candidatus Tanganyikabacteria bacterium]